jgi:hypothetical protein
VQCERHIVTANGKPTSGLPIRESENADNQWSKSGRPRSMQPLTSLSSVFYLTFQSFLLFLSIILFSIFFSSTDDASCISMLLDSGQDVDA